MNLLFDTPLIEGLRYAGEVIGAAEEQSLLDRLIPLELAPFRFHGWFGNRKTQSFGWRYDFDDASFTRTEAGARLLASTQHSVAEIAAQVGYESEAAFNRAFKREFGIPPARFRRQAKSQAALTSSR